MFAYSDLQIPKNVKASLLVAILFKCSPSKERVRSLIHSLNIDWILVKTLLFYFYYASHVELLSVKLKLYCFRPCPLQTLLPKRGAPEPVPVYTCIVFTNKLMFCVPRTMGSDHRIIYVTVDLSVSFFRSRLINLV